MAAETVLQVTNLTKVYRSRRRGETVAVDNVSFSVRRNEVVGLLGPNGAGKTTTIKSICTILRPTSGKIWIDGADAIRNPRAALEKVTGVLEGNRNIYWRLNVRDNLEFFAGLQGQSLRSVRSYIDELIEMFNLQGKVKEQARTLSRGMQQKLAVACALVKRTPILLLDEPTLGLDVETSYELRWILKRMAQEGQRTILLSSHDMNVVQDICERVIIINHGKIVVDDKIENLKKLFTASAYRFEIEGHLSSHQERQLKERFDLLQISTNGNRTVIEAELLDSQRVYEIIDVLKGNGCQLESVGKQYPNLEEIFLKIVKGEKK
ncbi:ABC transporter ATP-binding protein [Candidatus Acetothermia bacterium]|jgi:ABC-2 type transport system ATP-binding protein|nr:ABC transporter ATP-binding protein [Candidatus Acetothermia bacterium]MCI2430952.1 ABC transporter ATP-binding protein [Candidatus Acetothermia bacterium]MCI2437026.1 ABC transporter ATP-binding protein [Candidatus Acetothermia bacterium]